MNVLWLKQAVCWLVGHDWTTDLWGYNSETGHYEDVDTYCKRCDPEVQ